MTFEQLVIDARETPFEGRRMGFILRALEALAAERAAERERPSSDYWREVVDAALSPHTLGLRKFEREPRSISHWGMHA
jgi:hypothetical protein